MKALFKKKIFFPLSFTFLFIEIYLKKAKEELIKLNTELRISLKDKALQLEYTNQLLHEEISERKLAEKKLMQINEQLRKLTAHQQLVREDERSRISREIHDVLGQQLTVLKMDLSWLYKKLNKERTQREELSMGYRAELIDKTKMMLEVVDETVLLVKKISTELRPGILDDLGLIAAIEWQGHEISKKMGIECQFNTSLNDLSLETNISTGIFRIFQEATTNVARHSGASVLIIDIGMNNNSFFMTIKDNGKGISAEEISNLKSLGLLSMRERAHIMGGELSISGIIGKGTSIELNIPIATSYKKNL